MTRAVFVAFFLISSGSDLWAQSAIDSIHPLERWSRGLGTAITTGKGSALWLRWHTGIISDRNKDNGAAINLGVESTWTIKNWEFSYRYTKGVIGLGRDVVLYSPYIDTYYFQRIQPVTSAMSLHHFSTGWHYRGAQFSFSLRAGLARGRVDERRFFINNLFFPSGYYSGVDSTLKINQPFVSALVANRHIWFSVDWYAKEVVSSQIENSSRILKPVSLNIGGQWPIQEDKSGDKKRRAQSRRFTPTLSPAFHRSAVVSPWSGASLLVAYYGGIRWRYSPIWSFYADAPMPFPDSRIRGYDYSNGEDYLGNQIFPQSEIEISSFLRDFSLLQLGWSRRLGNASALQSAIVFGADFYHPYAGFKFENWPGYHAGFSLEHRFFRTQLIMRHVLPQQILLLDWSMGVQYPFSLHRVVGRRTISF